MLPLRAVFRLRPLAGVALAASMQPRETPDPVGRKPKLPALSIRLAACEPQRRPNQGPAIDFIDSKFDGVIQFVDQLPQSKDAQTIRSALQTAREDFRQPTMIMLVGAFSAGKSTLINSLLKKDVCATGITPTTSKLHFHQWEGRLLVDSAGLDAMNEPEHRQQALEAARRSNVAVVVLNARQPLRESEGDILRELIKANSAVVVAINYWNHVEKEKDRKECLKFVEEKLEEWMPDKRPLLIPMNAQDSGGEGVKKLRQELQSADRQGGFQKVASAKAAMLQGAKEMRRLLQDFRGGLEKQKSDKDETLHGQQKTAEAEDQHVKQLETMNNLGGSLWESAKSGAATGAMVDVFTGGMLLGIPTVLGAIGGMIDGGFGPSAEARKEHSEAISNAKLERARIKTEITSLQKDIQGLNRRMREVEYYMRKLECFMNEIEQIR